MKKEIYKNEIEYNASQKYLHVLASSTILLSGASGMVGKCLVDVIMEYNKRTNQPIRLIACSRDEERARERFAKYWNLEYFTFLKADVNKAIPECGVVDYIIHAASNTHPIQYSEDPIGTIEANIMGTKNLLEYAVSHNAKRFCFLSSVEIYGENRGDTETFDEKYLGYIDCNTVRSGYPESKRVGESLCNAYGQVYGKDGFSFVIPRLSRIYGPTVLASDSKAIAQFIKRAAIGEDIILKSEGTQKYSYTFVTDAVAAILFILVNGKNGEAYNIADEESNITLKKLAGILADMGNSRVVFEMPDEEERRGYSMLMKSMMNINKLKEMGWKARVHIEAGLGCCVESMRKETLK